jgi:hypothetical protein
MAASLEVDLELETDKAERKAKRNLSRSGADAGRGFAAAFSRNLGAIAAAAVGIGALFKGIDFFKESIRAAAVQQQAINDLNTQLAITGQFTQAVSQDLQNFASNLQNVSRFGDEAILSQLAFAQAMGASAEQSKQVVQASADLAESLNIDLNSATRNVAKTLGGYAGELGEVIPELKALTQEQLRAGAGIDLIAEKFAGAAQGRIRTFAGATAQLSNVFGGFQEALGRVVTNSPAFIAVINTTTQLIAKFTSSLNGISNQDPFGQLLLGGVTLAKFVNNNLIPPFRLFFGFINTGVNVARSLIQGLITAVATGINSVVELGAKIPGALGAPFREIADSVRLAKEAADEVLGEIVDETLNELVTPEQTENFRLQMDSIIQKYQEAIQASSQFKGAVNKDFEDVNKKAKQETSALAGVVKNGLVNLLSQSFQQLGKVLAGAESSFDAFVGIVINALGDLAISIGTTVIGSAKAIKALSAAIANPLAGGAAAIIVGGALVAAGAALKVFASKFGGGDTAAPAVGGFGAAAGQGIQTEDQFAPTTPDERVEPETRVQLTIQGDVLDSEETGLRISKILEDAALNQNVRVFGGIA